MISKNEKNRYSGRLLCHYNEDKEDFYLSFDLKQPFLQITSLQVNRERLLTTSVFSQVYVYPYCSKN